MLIVKPEERADVPGIRRVVESAFETAFEADMVDALRQQARPIVSFVATLDDVVVGHILFSPLTLSSQPDMAVMALAPVAVVPERQRQGIGSALVRAGIEECRHLGALAIVVIGHPEYYRRFGFVRASGFGLTSRYDVRDEAFMALELQPGALSGKAGAIHFHAAFGGA
jgi:putative acetyltransferase